MDVRVTWNPPKPGDAIASGLTAAVEHLAGEVTPRTPRLTGDLRQNMVVHHANTGSLEAGITFHSPYARRQHELETGNRTTPGTTGHFLEGPFNEQRETMMRLIANTIRGHLK